MSSIPEVQSDDRLRFWLADANNNVSMTWDIPEEANQPHDASWDVVVQTDLTRRVRYRCQICGRISCTPDKLCEGSEDASDMAIRWCECGDGFFGEGKLCGFCLDVASGMFDQGGDASDAA